MFNRWSQENFFRYMRAHYGLDALNSYATVDDDAARMTPNPARSYADRVLRDARQRLGQCEAAEGRASVGGRRPSKEIFDAFADARAEVEALAAAAKAIPAKAPLGEVRPDAVRLAPLSAPRRSRAIARLCGELTATKTLYPGTALTLVYSVKADR